MLSWVFADSNQSVSQSVHLCSHCLHREWGSDFFVRVALIKSFHMHSGGFNREVSHSEARELAYSPNGSRESVKAAASLRSSKAPALVSSLTCENQTLISTTAPSWPRLFFSFFGSPPMIFCSGPKQNQAGDSQLLAEVHPRGAGAVLQGHACDLLPVWSPHSGHSSPGGECPTSRFSVLS